MAFSNLLYLPPLGPDSPSSLSRPVRFHTYVRTHTHTRIHTRSYKLLPRYYTYGELLLNLIHPRMDNLELDKGPCVSSSKKEGRRNSLPRIRIYSRPMNNRPGRKRRIKLRGGKLDF